MTKSSYSEAIKELPAKRQKELKMLRRVIKSSKPKEIKEDLEGDELMYTLPLKFYPDSYTKKPLLYAALINRKSYISLNLISIFNDKVYRSKFSEKILATGACKKASGCCYQITEVNDQLINLLEKELKKMTVSKFIKTFEKYRQKSKP